MSKLWSSLKVVLITIYLSSVSSQSMAASICTGELYNPVTDTNWSNLFPMTIAGVSAGSSYPEPLQMKMPALCTCPSHFMGIPMIGIGITYWEPMFVAEVERSAGCLATVTDSKVFGSSFSILDSDQDSSGGSGMKTSKDKATRMQVHWYDYPVFAVMKLFSDFACLSKGGFAVAYFSEVNPVAQNDMWSLALAPDALFWSNYAVNIGATMFDAVASAAGYPQDYLTGVVGSGGSLGAPSLTVSDYNSSQMGNMVILAKQMALFSRSFMIWQTIGPPAVCKAVPNPFLVKSQFRIDPIGPVAKKSGSPIQFGKSEYLWNLPPMNYPTGESSRYLIWQAKQCCLRL